MKMVRAVLCLRCLATLTNGGCHRARRFNLLQGFWIYTTDDVETGIQNLLLCFEMLLAAIAHRWAFSYEEYEGGVYLRVR